MGIISLSLVGERRGDEQNKVRMGFDDDDWGGEGLLEQLQLAGSWRSFVAE
jgi:hypothetical protein